MSVRTSTVAVPGRTARRVEAAERVKSGAAQRAYARKRTREQLLDGIELPERGSTMAGRIPFVTAIIGLLGTATVLVRTLIVSPPVSSLTSPRFVQPRASAPARIAD